MDLVTMPSRTTEPEPVLDGARLLCNVLAVLLLITSPAIVVAVYRWGF